MYKEMQKAKKDGLFRFRCRFSSSGFLWSAYVYFDISDAIDELIEKKYEWIGKKEFEKQELINEIIKLNKEEEEKQRSTMKMGGEEQ